MKRQQFLIGALVVVLLLALTVAGSQGQEQPPDNELLTEPNDAIPIQGRLTDVVGQPLSGVFDIRFAVYDVAAGGYALRVDTDTVGVDNGLSHASMDNCTAEKIDGRQLWLGVTAGDDAEITPRRPIYAVPYAWSLRPGANIVNTSTTTPYVVGLYTASTAESGRGLYGHASTALTTGPPALRNPTSPPSWASIPPSRALSPVARTARCSPRWTSPAGRRADEPPAVRRLPGGFARSA